MITAASVSASLFWRCVSRFRVGDLKGDAEVSIITSRPDEIGDEWWCINPKDWVESTGVIGNREGKWPQNPRLDIVIRRIRNRSRRAE